VIRKLHNKDGFFKYYTPDAAILTLENGSRKWSSPMLSNDPFDNQFDLDFLDPNEELAAQSLEKLVTALTASEPISSNQFGSLTAIAEFIHQIHEDNPEIGYTEDDVACLKNIMLEITKDIKRIAPEVSNEIRSLLSDTRILCVSERNDSVLMWSHYAENHTGVVIKFLALEKIDSPLILAQPVRYSREMPQLSYGFLMDSKLGSKAIVDTLILSKSDDWAYEKEWRVWRTWSDKAREYYLLSYDPEEVGEVYLGCKMADSQRAKILEITRRKYPKAVVFQAQKHKKKYELVFHELTAAD